MEKGSQTVDIKNKWSYNKVMDKKSFLLLGEAPIQT